MLGQGNNLPKIRLFLTKVFSAPCLKESDFWFLTLHLLKYDKRAFRKPLADIVESNPTFSQYECSNDVFDKIFHIMLEDQDKLLHGLRFLSFFKSPIRESHYPRLIDCATNISQPEGFRFLYMMLYSSTESKIDIACNIASIAALYSLYQELLVAEQMYGIWHILGIPNFLDRLNNLPDKFEVQLILDLIEKNVLHEEIEDVTGYATIVEKEGFETFLRLSTKFHAKAQHRRNIKTIGSLLGKEVSCKVVKEYKNHYLVNAKCGFGMSGLLPITLAKHSLHVNDVIECTVISVIKGQHLLLLSQKPYTINYAKSIPVLNVGDEYEAKFSLYNKKIIPEILGYGPARAEIREFPRNFDYKKHHKVRVVKSKIANCEIEIIN